MSDILFTVVLIVAITISAALIIILLVGSACKRIAEAAAENKRREELNEAEDIKNSPDYINAINTADDFFNEVDELSKSYISHGIFNSLFEKYADTYEYIKTIKSNKYLEIPENVNKFTPVFENLESHIKEANEAFVKREMQECKTLFDDIDKKSLDNDQREAIVTDEDNELIIAGAGCGKTLTLSGKVQYLLKCKNIDPKKILLISYTTEAADELKERIVKSNNCEIDAKTFHALGLGIIKKAYGHKLDVADNSFCKEFIKNYFKTYRENNSSQIQDIMRYFGSYFELPDDADPDIPIPTDDRYKLNINDLSLFEDKKIKKTCKGEYVRSFEELLIADYLYFNGVEYEYEKEYPFSESEKNGNKSYRPDFYLPKYDIYLEHFGVSKDNRAPWLSQEEENKYLRVMNLKRELHKTHKTTLIETYSYYKTEGILFEKLEEELLQHGVVLEPANYEKMFDELKNKNSGRVYADFIDLMFNFITHYKSKRYENTPIESLSAEVDKFKNEYYRERLNLFLKIVSPVYKQYLAELKSTGRIDFSDMINTAIDIVEDGSVKYDYDYILVDEFQDISYNIYLLIKALKKASGAKIVCVGDDWQSIYRFAGSDVGVFIDFEKCFGYSAIKKIEHTYRNSMQLVNVAGNFIMKNSKQIKKDLVSDKQSENPIRLAEYSSKISEVLTDVIDEIVNEFGSDSEILLLGRTIFDLKPNKEGANHNLGEGFYIKDLKNNVIECKKYPKLNLRFMSIHSAKGLEAQNTIILNLEDKRLGFPNKIKNDPVMSLVLTDNDNYLYAEERRVFYVAMTRTKNNVYMLIPKNDSKKSIFAIEIMELLGEDCIHNLKNDDLPSQSSNRYQTPLCPVCGAEMVLREKYNLFWGCSRYPDCNGTRRFEK